MGFNISGLGSGVDWNLYIDSIIKGESDRLARTIGTKEVKATAIQTVFSNIRGAMQGLRSAVRDFTFAGDFKKKSVTSSDSDIVTATANLSALVQSFQMEVVQMATLEQHRLAFKGEDEIVTAAEASITINVRGKEHIIEVPPGTTFRELRDLINAEDIGVTVTVYDSKDGSETPVRMTIQDKTLGDYDDDPDTDNITFDISGLDQVETEFTRITKAQDSIVRINGEEVHRDSHIISDVVPGVTFQILKESPKTSVTLTVKESTSDAKDKLTNLVDRYNEVVGLLKSALAFDPKAGVQTSPTAGNSTLRNILTRLQSTFTSEVSTLPDENTIRSLADLGIETEYSKGEAGNNGMLSFDAAKFDKVLADKYEEVIEFFQGIVGESERLEGFAGKASNLMESFLNSTDGVITQKIQSLGEELKELNEKKLKKLDQLANKEERLVKQFARLETQLARLNNQQSQLSSAIQSLNLNNQYIANRRR